MSLVVGDLPRHMVDDAEGAEHQAFGSDQWHCGIEADTQFTLDRGIVGKTRVQAHIAYHEQPVRIEDAIGAEGVLA